MRFGDVGGFSAVGPYIRAALHISQSTWYTKDHLAAPEAG